MRVLPAMITVVASVVLSAACFDYVLHFTPYVYLVPRNEFVPGYRVGDPDLGLKITPNFPKSHMPFFGHPFTTWSNDKGCFDDPIDPKKMDTPFIYLTGDANTWGFVSHDDNWGTVTERTIGVQVLNCGAPGVGTLSELKKTRIDLSDIPSPKLIVVGYSPDDAIEDSTDYREDPMILCKIGTLPFHCWLFKNWLSQNSILYRSALGLLRPYIVPKIYPTAAMFTENFKTIDAFSELAASKGATLLFVLIPERGLVYSGAETFMEVKQHLDAHGIQYVDVTDVLHSYHLKNLETYFRIDTHPNALGNNVIGLFVSRYMVEHNLVAVEEPGAVLQDIERRMEGLTLRGK